MKEANPVSLRFGISCLSKFSNANPTFYTFDKRLRLEIIFYKLFLLVFEGYMYYTILNPMVLFTDSKLLVYFYFYATQFTTRRLRVRIRRTRVKRSNDARKLFKIPPKVILSSAPIIKNSNNQYLMLEKNKYKSEKVRRSPQVKLLLQLRLVRVQKRLEKTILKITGHLSRCFFKSVFSIFKSKHTKAQRHQSYIIYNKFFYYKRTDNYIDTINIILFTLKYHSPNLIISFVCREIERTRYHNRLLKMIKQILVEFYENTKIFTGLKFVIRGPVNKHARTKRITQLFGSVPTQTFTQNIEYYNFFSNTKFGTLGLRLWVY